MLGKGLPRDNEIHLNFFDYVIKLKSVKRAGWLLKTRIENPESVADHTFSMCVAGMVMSDIEGLDTTRVMKMILLHDLAESITGDLIPGQVSPDQKLASEDKAMDKILSSLPKKLRLEYQEIWMEYLKSRSKISKFVHRLDKLEMALQAEHYAKAGWPRKDLDPFIVSARKIVMTKSDLASKILSSLKPSH